MKRRDLVRRLEELGYRLERSKGPHDWYSNARKGIAVPRHAEVNENLARRIVKDAERWR